MTVHAETIWSYSAHPDMGAVPPANLRDALDEFKSHFDKEAIELQLLEMENALMHNSENKSDIVHSLFRDVHSLKGAWGMLKIGPLTHFLHIYEDVLGVISSNVLRISAIKNTEILDFFLQSLDLIERIMTNLLDDPEYVFKDNREFFGFYIRMILTARNIVLQPDRYLDIAELNEDVF